MPANEDDDIYTATPNRVRVYQDEWDKTWSVDGVDTTTAYLSNETPTRTRYRQYTERVWSFPTHAQAIAAVPDFIAACGYWNPSVNPVATEQQP